MYTKFPEVRIKEKRDSASVEYCESIIALASTDACILLQCPFLNKDLHQDFGQDLAPILDTILVKILAKITAKILAKILATIILTLPFPYAPILNVSRRWNMVGGILLNSIATSIASAWIAWSRRQNLPSRVKGAGCFSSTRKHEPELIYIFTHMHACIRRRSHRIVVGTNLTKRLFEW